MLPLDGVRVIEFCNVAAGPFCGMLLADLGADVIKVEHPDGGDTMRAWPPITEGYSENFASLNRNKRSVTLDLKQPEARQQARGLVLDADVLIENNRPGVMSRLGLGYEALQRDKPSLVYCSISAFGQEGPRSGEGGFDLTIQAMSGIMSVTGEPDGAPVKCGVPVSDFCAGLYAAYAIAAVLMRVRNGGAGEYIDVSMLGASLGIAALQTSEYFGTGRDPKKLGSAHPRNAPYQAFKAKDGYFAMAAGNDGLWRATCEALGRGDLSCRPSLCDDRAARATPGGVEGDPRGRRLRPARCRRCSTDCAQPASRARRSILTRAPWPMSRCDTCSGSSRLRCRTAHARAHSARRCASRARAFLSAAIRLRSVSTTTRSLRRAGAQRSQDEQTHSRNTLA